MQMTAYEVRISDWSSDVCSSDLKQALDNVTFNVPRVQIFGLLGPNGAGKSTPINIFSGMVNKTGGTARIRGFDIALNPRNSKNSIGSVPQEIVFDPFFTPFETLENQAGFYGVPKAQQRTWELLTAEIGWASCRERVGK